MFLTPEVLNANESLPPGWASQLPDVFQYVLAPLPFQLRCAAAIDGIAAAMQNATIAIGTTRCQRVAIVSFISFCVFMSRIPFEA
jgi:hypothetical protein